MLYGFDNTENNGLYMLDAEEPYFGYYDHGDQFGMVHYSDLADLPGKNIGPGAHIPK